MAFWCRSGLFPRSSNSIASQQKTHKENLPAEEEMLPDLVQSPIYTFFRVSSDTHSLITCKVKTTELLLSSIKIPLAALAAFHTTIEGFSVFTHPTTVRFIKGLFNLFPPVKEPSPLWDLNFILSSLRRTQFEPVLYFIWPLKPLFL